MPTIQVFTNAKLDDKQKQALLEKLTSVVVNDIGKPQKYAMVQIIDNVTMSMSGTTDPTAFIKVVNIGNIKKSVCDACAQKVMDVTQIKKERIYVHLCPVNYDNFAFYC